MLELLPHLLNPGLPPLARRELRYLRRAIALPRSTSARAERTRSIRYRARRARVYLRSRGENAAVLPLRSASAGLPPLARRERMDGCLSCMSCRSTSARAERTSESRVLYALLAVYLRSRGENPHCIGGTSIGRGLPPLARREPRQPGRSPASRGSTSARAERTVGVLRRELAPQVYLRSRGENS